MGRFEKARIFQKLREDARLLFCVSNEKYLGLAGLQYIQNARFAVPERTPA